MEKFDINRSPIKVRLGHDPSLVGNKGFLDTTHSTCGSLRTHQNNPILRQMYTKLIIECVVCDKS